MKTIYRLYQQPQSTSLESFADEHDLTLVIEQNKRGMYRAFFQELSVRKDSCINSTAGLAVDRLATKLSTRRKVKKRGWLQKTTCVPLLFVTGVY